jgi:hypothetical protein
MRMDPPALEKHRYFKRHHNARRLLGISRRVRPALNLVLIVRFGLLSAFFVFSVAAARRPLWLGVLLRRSSVRGWVRRRAGWHRISAWFSDFLFCALVIAACVLVLSNRHARTTQDKAGRKQRNEK